MTNKIHRRRFLTTAVALPLAFRSTVAAENVPVVGNTLDIHLHLFGTGDNGSGCRLSNTTRQGPWFEILTKMYNITERAETLDEGFVLALSEQLKNSGLTKGVILAQDAVYDSNGKPDWRETHFYIPNDYVLQVAAQFPDQMVPCISINPQRADAVEELEQFAAKGARILKIHPPTQKVDLLDKAFIPFYRKCVELKYLVMVHTGHEHSAPIGSILLASPRKLQLALEEGCTVVACHCGTGWPTDSVDMLPEFLKMIRKYPRLWGDTSILGTALRSRDMGRILADDFARSRLLHGSDFPFRSTPLAFANKIGLNRAVGLQTVENTIQQDFLLKEALGIGRTSAERAYQLVFQEDASG